MPTDSENPQKARQRAERRYQKIEKVGEGTYAYVFEAIEVATGRRVAIKKIKVRDSRDGIEVSALREIKALQELRHPNILEVIDVYASKDNLNVVLEYLPSDLEKIIKDKSLVFTAADIKSWMLMALRGVEHCHRNWILHRDLKPNNLLIATDGQLKLADFGLAREHADLNCAGKLTPQVVTLWYRAPELLFGAKDYGPSVDIWSIGCIFAELMLRTPYVAGESELGQWEMICQALGTPTEEDWPGMTKLSGYVAPKQLYAKHSLRTLFTAASQDALDLLAGMMRFDPAKRFTAREALEHKYFQNRPRPTPHTRLPMTDPERVREENTAEIKRKLDEVFQDDSQDGSDLDASMDSKGGRLPQKSKVLRRLDFL